MHNHCFQRSAIVKDQLRRLPERGKQHIDRFYCRILKASSFAAVFSLIFLEAFPCLITQGSRDIGIEQVFNEHRHSAYRFCRSPWLDPKPAIASTISSIVGAALC
jgi:hypothetical protein